MSSEHNNAILKFNQCPPTSEKLDYVDLINLDISEFDNPVTRSRLANFLLEAVTTHGFLTISNHGIPESLYSSQVDLAHAVLTLPAETKRLYEAKPEQDARACYVGFKHSGAQRSKVGFHQTLDHYNILAYDPDNHEHPAILRPHLDQINEIMNHLRHKILRKLLILVSIILEVPEERILATHASGADTSSEYLRYLLYNPRPADDTGQYRDLWLGGHTDLGSFTFLFSQPISALQIRTLAGEWKWVRYLPGTLVVNVGEALELLTGGLFRATVHRVVRPPKDQERAKRLGIIYFARPNDGQKLAPIESPLLRKLGIDRPLDEKVYTMSQYLYARKNGYKRIDFDQDRPRKEGYHTDPLHGKHMNSQYSHGPVVTT